ADQVGAVAAAAGRRQVDLDPQIADAGAALAGDDPLHADRLAAEADRAHLVDADRRAALAAQRLGRDLRQAGAGAGAHPPARGHLDVGAHLAALRVAAVAVPAAAVAAAVAAGLRLGDLL